MINCPLCKSTAWTRGSGYLPDGSKEIYVRCQNIDCSSTFKTRESIEHVIRQSLPRKLFRHHSHRNTER
ncbi:ogr/Delta-like zinc finger family protein [Serratia plymuthica]|uniref:ogr/Delta-like zinc finger family protein n=1 Tax=Serratia plymuthica TaxID=82996 RepID=UPI0018D6F9E2|nr:ogr/Delta-like zinc finger family protein [Serratia plymuthica]QPS87451.1 ogr/Delta-like zinc finger family protein [Serratia plymuthica]